MTKKTSHAQHQEKARKSLKKAQGSPAPETSALSNAALNAYVQDYLKDPSEEVYALLEDSGEYPGAQADAPLDTERFLQSRHPSVLTLLVSSLQDNGQSVECLPEEARKKRALARTDNFFLMNQQLAQILAKRLISQSDIDSSAGSLKKKIKMYEELLRQIIDVNRRNKQRLLRQRKEHFAQLVFVSLLEGIDSAIESVYTKKYKAKRKKKEEDSSYFAEMEKLLENRGKLKQLCQSLPESLLELPSDDLGLESLFEGSGLSAPDQAALQGFLPPEYFSVWKEV